jgi:hypothetical protein
MDTIQVREPSDLSIAARESRARPLRIDLNTEIAWTGNFWDYSFGSGGSQVEIRGGLLDFTGYESKWPEPGDANGLTVAGAEVRLRDVTIRGYNGIGSALRANVSESLDVLDCHFIDCGTKVLTKDVAKPGYTNGIGCHSMPRRLRVSGCTFERVALNDEQLAHVLYVGAREECIVTGNRYYGCGSVWGCYSPRTVIVGEYANFGGTPDAWDRKKGEQVHPWGLVHNGGGLHFCGNTVRGRLRYLLLGNAPRLGSFAGNRLEGLEMDSFGFEWNVGVVNQATFLRFIREKGTE